MGNVLATVSDRRGQVNANADTLVDYFIPDVVTANDYYPFGMLMQQTAGDGSGVGAGGTDSAMEVLTVSNRAGNTPAQYTATNSVEFMAGFESGTSDSFTAFITGSVEGGSNGGNSTEGGSGIYRYGFDGKENDNELKGEGNQQDYGMRIYDPRLGRFLSVDPITNKYPYYSPYQFAGNSPIKFIDLDGLEPEEPDQHEYEGKVSTINSAFNKSGGDDKYQWEMFDSEIGDNTNAVDKSKFFANDNGKNSVVNETSQFIVKNENLFGNGKDLINKLLGDFIYGDGPENWVFPENGKFSTELKGSTAVGETLVAWAKNGFKDDRYGWTNDLRGEVNIRMNSGNISLEHFLGSVSTKITTVNENTVKVEIFNVTSFSSGYLQKDLPVIKWFVDSPKSTKRILGKEHFQPTYSNTSQYFSLTMSTSEANKLISQYSAGAAPQKKL